VRLSYGNKGFTYLLTYNNQHSTYLLTYLSLGLSAMTGLLRDFSVTNGEDM